MNYLRFVQHYEAGFEDGRRQAQSDGQSRDLMTTLFSLFFKSFGFAILICPGIFCAYFILAAVKHYNIHLTGWTYGWTFVGVVYGFALPVYVVHIFGYNLFKPAPGNSTAPLDVISWIAAGVLGIYIYSRFQFKRADAPGWAGWAYRIGKGR